ncbi:MAG: SMI1/KNR4 family protein [Oscillospiraceae bacterium]|nr:SMI1/KNR4 family protein [Oscillospiraceae bacterium]
MFSFVKTDEEIALIKSMDRDNNYSKDDGEYVPVTNEDIDRIEKKFGIKFPDILREYYLKYNAKWIHSVEIHAPGGDEAEIHEILPIINTPINRWGIKNEFSVECIKDNEMNEPNEYGWPLRIRNNFVPLALDGCGDTYYWDSNDGKVYISFCANEDENGLEIPYYVCSSVEEMFKLMDEAYEKEKQG